MPFDSPGAGLIMLPRVQLCAAERRALDLQVSGSSAGDGAESQHDTTKFICHDVTSESRKSGVFLTGDRARSVRIWC